MANQEPARAIADRFDITRSSYNRVFRRVVMAAVGLSNEYIRWPTGEYQRSISKRLPTRSLAHTGFDTWLPALLATGLEISRIY